MLALKCVFIDKDKIPTLIFDEIDTGISGSIAKRVGKMYGSGNKASSFMHYPPSTNCSFIRLSLFVSKDWK